MSETHSHAVRFAIVGVTNTLLDYCLFNLLYYAAGLTIIAANLLSSSVAVLWSFLLNRNWTFADRKAHSAVTGQFLRHLLTTGGGVILSTIAVWIAAHFVPAYVAKVAAVGVSFAWNYTLSRHWVFHRAGP